MHIMAGLFVIGFICNLLIKAVDKRFHMEPDWPWRPPPKLAGKSAPRWAPELGMGRT